jgi:hypothetical protein
MSDQGRIRFLEAVWVAAGLLMIVAAGCTCPLAV